MTGSELTQVFVEAVDRFRLLVALSGSSFEDLIVAADEVLLAGRLLPMDSYNSLEADFVMTDIEDTRRFMRGVGMEMLQTPRRNSAGSFTFRPSV